LSRLSENLTKILIFEVNNPKTDHEKAA